MPVFRVPKDPPPRTSCPEIILDDLVYAVSSFKGFLIVATDYATWFLESSAKPIIEDCPISGGWLLGGITRAQQVSEAWLRLHVVTLYAWVRDLEGAATARDGYMQEEIASLNSREGAMAVRSCGPVHCHQERERSHHIAQTALL